MFNPSALLLLASAISSAAGVSVYSPSHASCVASIPEDAVAKGTDTFMTPSLCQEKCSDHAYVALKNGNECFCLDSEPSDASDECTASCVGYDQLFCGGESAYNVYESQRNVTAPSGEQPNYSSITAELPVENWPQLACVGSVDSDSQGKDIYQTPALCANKCGGSPYVAVKNQECFCLNTIPVSTNATCSIQCPGYPDVMCGGDEGYSVYHGSNSTSSSTDSSSTTTTGTTISDSDSSSVNGASGTSTGAGSSSKPKNSTDSTHGSVNGADHASIGLAAVLVALVAF
ncbi:hypothetical protein DICA0_D25840 [Diutina catenulata]